MAFSVITVTTVWLLRVAVHWAGYEVDELSQNGGRLTMANDTSARPLCRAKPFNGIERFRRPGHVTGFGHP